MLTSSTTAIQNRLHLPSLWRHILQPLPILCLGIVRQVLLDALKGLDLLFAG